MQTIILIDADTLNRAREIAQHPITADDVNENVILAGAVNSGDPDRYLDMADAMNSFGAVVEKLRLRSNQAGRSSNTLIDDAAQAFGLALGALICQLPNDQASMAVIASVERFAHSLADSAALKPQPRSSAYFADASVN